MKKLWIALICAAVMTLCLCAVAGAASYQFDSGTGKLTITGDGEITKADVLSACNNKPTSITSVEIGQGITGIGESAFSGCNSMHSITISTSVTSIGNKAFMNCTILENITIPTSVTSIGEKAFYDCMNLESV